MNNKNSSLIKYIFVVLLGLAISSCDNKNKTEDKPVTQVQNNNLNKITKIDFVEQEKGIEPYKVRLVVSYEFLRFDDGESSNGYILYNRKNKIIYNVNDEEETIMEIHPKRKSVVSPIKLNNRDKKIAELTDAPKVNNTIPIKYEFKTNSVVCFGIVSVKGLLPMATKALREFQQALADDSTYTLESIPADMQDACALSMNTFTSTRHLKYGFPIQFWSPKGYSRALIGFDEDFKSSEKLFVLPEKYKSYTVDDLRSGTMG